MLGRVKVITGIRRSQLYVLIDKIQEVEPIQNPWLPNNKDAKITFVDVLIGLMNKKNVDVYVPREKRKKMGVE